MEISLFSFITDIIVMVVVIVIDYVGWRLDNVIHLKMHRFSITLILKIRFKVVVSAYKYLNGYG